MTRVWLAGWEWACCGEAFGVGDEVDFGIQSRDPAAMLAELFDPEVLATVDAVESHHEEEFTDRVRGRVVAVQAVTREVVERRVLRRPGRGAPPDAVMPEDGEEWPLVGRELGNGVFVGTRPTRYLIEAAPVPGSATLTPAAGVRLREADQSGPDLSRAAPEGDPPPERRRSSHAGWLVDVQGGP